MPETLGTWAIIGLFIWVAIKIWQAYYHYKK